MLEWFVVNEQFGRVTGGLHWHVPSVYNVWADATPEQSERYVPAALRGEGGDAYAVTEAEAGSDPNGIATTAVAANGGWRINGEKWFVTSGDVARVLIVMANVVDGAERLPTLFLVEPGSAGVEFVDDPLFTHNYPHGHPTIRFTDVEVAADAVIGGVGNGDELQRRWFTEERLGIATHGLGAMWRLLDETTEWALTRVQGGQRIMDYQGISFPLADSATDAAAGAAAGPAGVRHGRRRRRPQADPRQGLDGQAVRVRGRRPVRRPRRAGVRWPRLPALQRRRALPARAARRPDLGGDQRDPAADHRAGAGAPRGRGDDPLTAVHEQASAVAGVDLGRLMRPASVAVVGATDRPGSYAAETLLNLEHDRLRGPVWGVNPRRTEVLGRACVPSVLDLPEAVDALVVAIPAAGVAEAIEQAGARGCGGAVVFSAGFGEVARACRTTAIWSPPPPATGCRCAVPTATASSRRGTGSRCGAMPCRRPEPGAVALVSQSGNVAVNALATRRGLRFHTVVASGNQAVLSAADYLEYLAAEDDVGAVALYLEDDGGPRLCDGLAACADAGVPVVVLKVGRTEAGSRAAAAHSGALAGDQRVFRSLVDEAGGGVGARRPRSARAGQDAGRQAAPGRRAGGSRS